MTRQCEMVWPIIRGESYVGETGKSMEVMGLAVSRKDNCRSWWGHPLPGAPAQTRTEAH